MNVCTSLHHHHEKSLATNQYRSVHTCLHTMTIKPTSTSVSSDLKALYKQIRYYYYYPPFASIAKGEVFVLLYVFCLFGQRFLDNPRADSSQVLHAGVLWFRMCLLPFWGLAAPGGRKRGKWNFRYYGSQWGNFAFWRFLSDISATRGRIYTKFYLYRDNFCPRAPSFSEVHRL